MKHLLLLTSLLLVSTIVSAYANHANAANFKFCYEDWAPYATGDAKKPTGITIDLVTQAMKELGHTVSFELINSAQRCTTEVKKGNLDGQLFATADEKNDWVVASVPTEYWVFNVIVHKDNPMTEFKSFEDFNGKSFGTVPGYEYPDDIAAAMKKYKIESAPESLLNLKKISAKRLDFTIDDPLWATFEAKENKLDIKVLPPQVAFDPTYVAMATKHKDVVAKLDQVLKKYMDTGVFDKAYASVVGMDFKTFKQTYKIK